MLLSNICNTDFCFPVLAAIASVFDMYSETIVTVRQGNHLPTIHALAANMKYRIWLVTGYVRT